MKLSHSALEKSLAERILHALGFEILAILLTAPVLAVIMDRSMTQTGLLTLMFASVAMFWNMLYNALFDGLQRRLGFVRNLRVRLLHALGFEVGLIVFLVPLAAWWLSVSLVQAFLLDIGLILFFLPYTVAYNWSYDILRLRLLARRSCAAS